MSPSETAETRLRRLRMRSWRRGMKEMDFILGAFADGAMKELSAAELDIYELLLQENDQDLYQWITTRLGARQGPVGPDAFAAILDDIARYAGDRLTHSSH